MGQLFEQHISNFQAIQRTLGHRRSTTLLCGQDSIIVNRLKLGHTRLTQTYPLSRETQLECIPRQCPLMVKHILLENTFCLNVSFFLMFVRNISHSHQRKTSIMSTFATSLLLLKKLIFTIDYNELAF